MSEFPNPAWSAITIFNQATGFCTTLKDTSVPAPLRKNKTAVPIKALSEFHRFTELPTELRLAIWKLATPREARVIEVLRTVGPYNFRLNAMHISRPAHMPLVPLLKACKESRQVVEENFTMVSAKSFAPSMPALSVLPINFDTDVLFINGPNLGFLQDVAASPDRLRVKTLMLSIQAIRMLENEARTMPMPNAPTTPLLSNILRRFENLSELVIASAESYFAGKRTEPMFYYNIGPSIMACPISEEYPRQICAQYPVGVEQLAAAMFEKHGGFVVMPGLDLNGSWSVQSTYRLVGRLLAAWRADGGKEPLVTFAVVENKKAWVEYGYGMDEGSEALTWRREQSMAFLTEQEQKTAIAAKE